MNSEIESGTSHLSSAKAISQNIRNLPKAFTWTALFSGVLIVFVSTTGPIAILYQAAEAGQLTAETTNSWLFEFEIWDSNCWFVGSHYNSATCDWFG